MRSAEGPSQPRRVDLGRGASVLGRRTGYSVPHQRADLLIVYRGDWRGRAGEEREMDSDCGEEVTGWKQIGETAASTLPAGSTGIPVQGRRTIYAAARQVRAMIHGWSPHGDFGGKGKIGAKPPDFHILGQNPGWNHCPQNAYSGQSRRETATFFFWLTSFCWPLKCPGSPDCAPHEGDRQWIAELLEVVQPDQSYGLHQPSDGGQDVFLHILGGGARGRA